VQVDSKLDTGVSFCIFERAYREMLGLDVESGTKTSVSTVNRTFEAYFLRSASCLAFRYSWSASARRPWL
jgi:hypothetical protein